MSLFLVKEYNYLGGVKMFSFLNAKPEVYAKIKGNSDYPDLKGTVYFYEVHNGTVVVANIENMPNDKFHGFHIHEGEHCSGTIKEPFQDADGHYNPTSTTHPNHVGDMPPILSSDGIAFSAFYTNRFYPEDVVRKTVIIHEMPDDFKTQPSGEAGAMIACGEIVEVK